MHDKMRAVGLEPVPSIASLAGVFREAGVARLEPSAASRPARRHSRQKVSSAGVIHVDRVFYSIDVDHAFKQVLVVTDGDKITITDVDGEILAQHTRPHEE